MRNEQITEYIHRTPGAKRNHGNDSLLDPPACGKCNGGV